MLHGQRSLQQQQQQSMGMQEGSHTPAGEVNGNGQSVRPAEDTNSQGRAVGEGADLQRTQQSTVRQSWEHVEEVGQILKTAFPLLIMNLETTAEQISTRMKTTPEEEVYRLMYFLSVECTQVSLGLVSKLTINLNGIQQFLNRVLSSDDLSLTVSAMNIIARQAHSLTGQARVSRDTTA